MSPLGWHLFFEVLAYAVGMQLFLRERRRHIAPVLDDADASAWIGVGAVVGAAIGAKLAYWIDDPLGAFARFPDVANLLGGKSIVGALLGGLIGVEWAKRLAGATGSSGDAFVLPLGIGICIGRIGCFLAALADRTYGDPTALPWGVDFGDGVPRHPTQLYEIAFVLILLAAIARMRSTRAAPGDRFRAFMVGYLAFRLMVDAIKPLPFAYFGFFSGLQLLCLAGLLYYHRFIRRWATGSAWAPS